MHFCRIDMKADRDRVDLSEVMAYRRIALIRYRSAICTRKNIENTEDIGRGIAVSVDWRSCNGFL